MALYFDYDEKSTAVRYELRCKYQHTNSVKKRRLFICVFFMIATPPRYFQYHLALTLSAHYPNYIASVCHQMGHCVWILK